ncbi:MAG: hypothetical protein IJ692_00005, partial [Alloprevotella sp.]|nr:hypothetical protein [Alloprevotella sp.]
NRLEIPGGYLTFGHEFYQFTPSQGGGLSFDGEWTRSLASHYYVTDYLGSVMAVCSGETGAVEQTASYMPSGVVFSSTNYGTQPYKFCGKEDITMHGFNMYDSFARYQYSRFPRFTTMDPLAEWDYATSPYAYCRNDFVNLVDPWGLYWWTGEYEEGLPVYEFEAAIVYGHRRGTIVGDIYGAEFSLWCDNVNRYRSPLPGGFTTYQTYVDRYDPNLYGGGGGVSKEDWEMLTKIWEAENTGVSSIATTLDNQTVKTAEISYLITEKIDNKPLTSAFIDRHASNLKYIKVAKRASKGLSFFFLACDVVEGFVDDDYTFGYHTLRNLITGAGGMIGARYGGIYGAKWGAVGHLPGAVAGGIAGTISGALVGEYISGWMFDEIYYSF